MKEAPASKSLASRSSSSTVHGYVTTDSVGSASVFPYIIKRALTAPTVRPCLVDKSFIETPESKDFTSFHLLMATTVYQRLMANDYFVYPLRQVPLALSMPETELGQYRDSDTVH